MILRYFLDIFGILLRYFWDTLWILLGYFKATFGIPLGIFLDTFLIQFSSKNKITSLIYFYFLNGSKFCTLIVAILPLNASINPPKNQN